MTLPSRRKRFRRESTWCADVAAPITGLKPCAYSRREKASVAITDGGYDGTVCGWAMWYEHAIALRRLGRLNCRCADLVCREFPHRVVCPLWVLLRRLMRPGAVAKAGGDQNERAGWTG